MKGKNEPEDDLLLAVRDLTRVMLAVNGEVTNKSELIRKLHLLSIPPTRIALILGMKPKDVTSALSKAKKTEAEGRK